MNLLLLEATERDPRDPTRFVVTGARATHVATVLGKKPGDTVRIGLVDGPLGVGTVSESEHERLSMDCVFDDGPPPPSGLSLILAVPRAIILKRVFLDAASIGVDRIVLCRSWRVQRAYLSARILEPAHYRPVLRAGMAQGRVTREPHVALEPRFRRYVEDRVAGDFPATRRIVAHPDAEGDLADLAIAANESVVVAVGPEGGWLTDEVSMFEDAGFEAVHSGARALRVEAAVVALLAQVDLLRRSSLRGSS